MQNLKDRKPAVSGSRSFSRMKIYMCFVAVLSGLMLWYATRLVLVIKPEGGQQPIVNSISKGDSWRIAFTHSVELTGWEENFTVNGAGDMVMTNTRFESLGWGFPYSAADGKLTHTEDGKYNLVMNRPYKTVDLRISEQAMQHIIYGSEDYDLIALYGQGTAVKIMCQYRYQYWLDK